MKHRCKKCKLEGNVGVCDNKVCVGFNLGSKTPTQNDWETEYTKLIKDKLDYPGAYRNCDGFNCTPDKMRNFIHQLLADARREVIEKVEKELEGLDCGFCNYEKEVKERLATLREEGK